MGPMGFLDVTERYAGLGVKAELPGEAGRDGALAQVGYFADGRGRKPTVFCAFAAGSAGVWCKSVRRVG